MNVWHDNKKIALSAAHNISTESTTFDFHFHDTYEIFFFISGKAQMFVTSRKYLLHPGSLLFLNTNEIHRVFPDFSAPYERMTVNFNPALIHSLPLNVYNPLACFQNTRIDNCNIAELDKASSNKCYELITHMISALKSPKSSDELLALSYLLQLLALGNDEFSKSNTHALPFPKLIEDALKIINDRISEPISLEIIACELSVDPFYLGHEFKKHTGTSPYHYIITKRIALAKESLANGANGLQACEESGFGEYTNFCRTFKKYVSLSPMQYQKSLCQ